MKYIKHTLKFFKIYLTLAFVSSLLVSCTSSHIQTAGTFAPSSEVYSDAVIQVYSARTRGVKKVLAVHTWISVKQANSPDYTSYEIIGWRLRGANTALAVRQSRPDRDWAGNHPDLLLDIRGKEAERLIPKVIAAVDAYPHKDNYHAWPGPNSNTFTAFIGQSVPELGLDLPSTAIGKDYRELKNFVGLSSSGSGLQLSLWGLLSFTLGAEEGIELNVLGLNFELDIFDFAIELPGVGRLGASDVEHVEVTTIKTESNLTGG
ncbi:MAG: hypothetical protein ACI9IA_001943 [Enterobacterales bacterium]|jgi:hypothetical protein